MIQEKAQRCAWSRNPNLEARGAQAGGAMRCHVTHLNRRAPWGVHRTPLWCWVGHYPLSLQELIAAACPCNNLPKQA
jgi:hypothetical protein